MKKVLSMFLALMMLMSFAMPVAFAETAGRYSIAFETDINADEIVANAVYTPVNNEVKSFVAILALYSEDNELLDMSKTNSVNNSARVSIRNQANGYMVKAYVWDSMTKMNALTDTIYTAKSDFLAPTEFVDFVVDVETGREPVILQLSDPQIAASTEAEMDSRCYDYIRETVNATNPDLILITGDLLLGRDDVDGSMLNKLIEVFEEFEIPWAPIFGNHDNESPMGVDWQCKQLEAADNCLFKQRTLSGNGNYTVGITQGGKLKRVIFMMDTNGCGKASEETLKNPHFKINTGLGTDQVAWFQEVAAKINRVSPGMKYTFGFHMQPEMFRVALSQYGTVNADTINNPINIDTHPNKKDTDFGYIGRDLKNNLDTNYSIYNSMKALGCDSILAGHEHCNSASVVYDGVRFQYGQKSSTYDRANYMKDDGTIVGAGYGATTGKPMIGGTVMKMSEADGSISDAYIYYCDTGIDDILNNLNSQVDGMKIGKELTTRAGTTVETTNIKGYNAYKISCTDTRSRIYVDLNKLAGKNTFTFSALVPEGTPIINDNGSGEIQIRVKGAANHSGYEYFSSTSTDASRKIPFGEWKTYTVDISSLGNSCTEFAFTFQSYSTVYIKDVAVDGDEITVDGMQMGEGLTPRDGTTVETATIKGYNAYRISCTDTRSRIYIDLNKLAGKNTFTFSALVPEGTPIINDNGSGEIQIRVKGAANHSGYEYFSSTSTDASRKIPFGEWKTYTVDISSLGNSCTEFAFTFQSYSTVYIKDIAIN